MEAILFNIQRFCLHDGPGIRTTVFFKGCNLRCAWCANPESQSSAVQPELSERLRGKRYTQNEVLSEALKDKAFYAKDGGGVTLSGGEPLLQADFCAELCGALRARGVSVGLETAANVPSAEFQKVFSRVDFAFIDIKHWDDSRHKKGTGSGLSRILANMEAALKSQTPVIPRIPVIPNFNDSLEDARAFAALLKRLGAKNVQLLPFHQMGEKKYQELGIEYSLLGAPQLHDEDLTRYARELENGGIAVQTGG